MANPAYDKRSTLPGSAGWYEPDGTFHPFNVDLEPDAEFAARVKDLGARSAIASLGGVIVSASSTDQVRAAKSSIDSLLYEMQHPKQAIYEGADVACAGGGSFLCPWLDVSRYRSLSYYVANTGAQVSTAINVNWSEDPAGSAPFTLVFGYPVAIPAGATWFTQNQTIVTGGWINTSYAPLGATYFRVLLTSALGTTARLKVVGAR